MIAARQERRHRKPMLRMSVAKSFAELAKQLTDLCMTAELSNVAFFNR